MRYLSITCATMMLSSLWGNPQGEHIILGDVRVTQGKTTTTISQTTAKAIVDWDSFSIAANEMVTFNQPADSSILNRVTGANLSDIQGHLTGSGAVYLINTHGVLVGAQGVIKTKGDFLASTLDISNNDYTANKTDYLFAGKDKSKVTNLGYISSQNGNVFLIATRVSNKGTINAPSGSASLAAGTEVLIQEEGEQKIFVRSSAGSRTDNEGTILAASVELKASGENIYALAINQKGTIKASGLQTEAGKVFLTADTGSIEHSGQTIAPSGNVQILGNEKIVATKTSQIDTSDKKGSGTVTIGKDLICGKYRAQELQIDAGALINANASTAGNGGNILLWADSKTAFYGTINAQGGFMSGNGGFVEVSCPKNLIFKGTVSTTAPHGTTGTLSLDPSDIYIADFGGIGSSSPAFPTTPPGTYDPAVVALLDVADVMASLANNNVIVTTTSGTNGLGDISILSNISWATQTTLQILADHSITLNDVILENTFTGAMSPWTAFDFQANQGMTPIAGDFHGITLEASSVITAEGTISFVGTGGTFVGNRGLDIGTSTIQSTTTGGTLGAIELTGQSGAASVFELYGIAIHDSTIITAVDAPINITGTSNGTNIEAEGVYIYGSAEIASTGISPITILGTGGASGSIGYDSYGIEMDYATITSVSGPISLTGLNLSGASFNEGIYIHDFAEVSSTGTGGSAATITLNGTGGTGDYLCEGIFMDTATLSSLDGAISVTGVALGVVDYNAGITLHGATIQSSSPVTISGTPGVGTVAPGLYGDELAVINAPSSNITGTILFD